MREQSRFMHLQYRRWDQELLPSAGARRRSQLHRARDQVRYRRLWRIIFRESYQDSDAAAKPPLAAEEKRQ